MNFFLNAGHDLLNRFYDPLSSYDIKLKKQFCQFLFKPFLSYLFPVFLHLFEGQNKKKKSVNVAWGMLVSRDDSNSQQELSSYCFQEYVKHMCARTDFRILIPA